MEGGDACSGRTRAACYMAHNRFPESGDRVKSKPTPNGNVAYMKIGDLIPDSNNANKGTRRGEAMIEDSLRKYGAGRSILLDKKGRIIAGNKTSSQAGQIGMEDVIVVKTDGTKLVAVQRMDLDLETDASAKQLGLVDNRASEVSLSWDASVLQQFSTEFDMTPFFTSDELAKIVNDAAAETEAASAKLTESFSVLIEGLTEMQQLELLERLGKEGLKCRALIS